MLPFTFTSIAIEHMRRRGIFEQEMLGTIPNMLSVDDPAGAVDQIDRAYASVGGGWRDSVGERFTLDVAKGQLRYPGDPPLPLIARARLREEEVLFFDGAWVAVVQPDGTSRVARID